MAHFSAPKLRRRPSKRILAVASGREAFSGGRGAAAVAQASGRHALPSFPGRRRSADARAVRRGWANGALSLAPPWVRDTPPLSHMSAAWELLTRAGLTHHRPDYGIRSVIVAGEETPVREEVAAHTAFGDLLRFRKDGDPQQPRILLVAPLSGHFATLLRTPCRPCCPTTMSTSPTGATPAMRRSTRARSASTNTSPT
ncbi:MAG: hypothetical protein WDM85_07520 [Caulobacteraceae bacterium]